jgi:hypothetical protein
LEKLEAEFSKRLNKKFAFKRYSPAEVESWNWRLRSVWDEDGKQLRELADDESAFIFNEINLSKWDFKYWANRYATVVDSEGQIVKLNFVPSQELLYARMGELEESSSHWWPGKFALIIAKARRVGATVMCSAAIAHNIMLRKNAKGLIASNEPANSLEVYKILNRIHTNLPPWMRAEMTEKVKSEHIYFGPPLDSDITIGHGAQKNPMGQGIRLDALHLSELSSWLPVGTEQIEADILPAFRSSRVPSSFFLAESTGESVLQADSEWFQEQYELAAKNKGSFRAIFLAWMDRPDLHSMSAEGITFSETTLAAAARILRETGKELTREQMAFYQITREDYESKGKLATFGQEYPSSQDECFQSAMKGAWSAEVVDRVRNDLPGIQLLADVNFRTKKISKIYPPEAWDNDPVNRIRFYEPLTATGFVRPGFTYAIGVDTSYGQEGKDFAAVVVNRIGNRLFKDKQVADFHGYIGPEDLASVCWLLGHMFTDRETGLPALMVIERNGPGLVTLSEMVKSQYKNLYIFRREGTIDGGMTNAYGWSTNGSSRPLMTKKLVQIINDKEYLVSSPYFIEEMKQFVNYGWKRSIGVDGFEYFAHAPGKHDDLLFAGGIAYYASHDYDHLNVAEERRKTYEAEAAKLLPKTSNRNYQNTVDWDEDSQSGSSWEDTLANWESRAGF